MKPDVVVKITRDFRAASAGVKIATNARHEALDEILSNWLQDEIVIGKNDGRSCRPEDVPEVVVISIGLRIQDEAWGFESNSGSRSLDVGIVADVLARLSEIPKTGFDEGC